MTVEQQVPIQLAKKIFSLIDLTSLNDNDTEATITTLCHQSTANFGHVAAVCLYPQFVRHARKCLQNSPVKIATVANFPAGIAPADEILKSIRQSIENGADEIDVVFPFHDFLNGDRESPKKLIQACKKMGGDKILLKVILETGAIQDPRLIAEASQDALQAGADFIKTSTGKIAIGATLDAATAMLQVIRQLTPALKRPLGLKVSGGVRTLEQASEYIALAEDIMGKEWITPNTFRIGASQLVDVILDVTKHL